MQSREPVQEEVGLGKERGCVFVPLKAYAVSNQSDNAAQGAS